jgi:hypothetical protein
VGGDLEAVGPSVVVAAARRLAGSDEVRRLSSQGPMSCLSNTTAPAQVAPAASAEAATVP